MIFKKKSPKIFIISCLQLDNNKVKITFLLNQNIKFNIYNGYFQSSIILDNSRALNKIKIGKWVKFKVDLDKIIYIYQTSTNKLIYKQTFLDNYIYIGDYNSYGHKLIYKAKIEEDKTLTPLYRESDYFKRVGGKKIWLIGQIIMQ